MNISDSIRKRLRKWLYPSQEVVSLEDAIERIQVLTDALVDVADHVGGTTEGGVVKKIIQEALIIWHPMETAPKGVEVILFDPRFGGHYTGRVENCPSATKWRELVVSPSSLKKSWWWLG